MNNGKGTLVFDRSALRRGQQVMVTRHGDEVGTGVVDDVTGDGSVVWIVFGGAFPRRLFLESDPEEILAL